MRVLKASSISSLEGLAFVDLNPSDAEPYAILSHTWGEGEVLFAHVIDGTATSMPAYPKVQYACQQAIADGFEYVWIDTCCMEKSSSAELSEAINSMFAWYRDAAVCYAYLFDCNDGIESLENSRWFTRGWTLQELLAPNRVVFYGADWVEIGTKDSLKSTIARVTQIREDVLTGERLIAAASIANRMGWASRRVTTRPEDIAYGLMGIFNVNMPVLYGEGTKAFLRLQEEILKKTNDHTLFAWVDEDAPDDKQYGLLAPSPRCFAETRMLLPYESPPQGSPIAMTNEGLSIELRLSTVSLSPLETQKSNTTGMIFGGLLDCPNPVLLEGSWFMIHLMRTGPSHNRFARVRAAVHGGGISSTGGSSDIERRRVLVRAEPQGRLVEADKTYPTHLLKFRSGPSSKIYRLADVAHYPSGKKVKPVQAEGWDGRSGNNADWARVPVRKFPGRLTAVLLFVRVKDGKRLLLSIGSRDSAHLGFQAVEMDGAIGDVKAIPDASAMQASFIPTAVGETLELPDHTVRVTMDICIQNQAKIYSATVDIRPKWPLNPSELESGDDASDDTRSSASKAPEYTPPKGKETGTSKRARLSKLFSPRSEK